MKHYEFIFDAGKVDDIGRQPFRDWVSAKDEPAARQKAMGKAGREGLEIISCTERLAPQGRIIVTCPVCGGAGKLPDPAVIDFIQCPECEGECVVMEPEAISY